MSVNTLYPMTAVILHWQNSIEIREAYAAYVSWSAPRNLGNSGPLFFKASFSSSHQLLVPHQLGKSIGKKHPTERRPTPSQTHFHRNRRRIWVYTCMVKIQYIDSFCLGGSGSRTSSVLSRLHFSCKRMLSFKMTIKHDASSWQHKELREPSGLVLIVQNSEKKHNKQVNRYTVVTQICNLSLKL